MKSLRVGLAYNLMRGGGEDEAEFDTPETLDSIVRAIEAHGHKVVLWEATPDFVRMADPKTVDIVFNIAEGFSGSNREAHVPAVLEFLGIPFTGADPAGMSICMDKGLAKRLMSGANVRTPEYEIMDRPGISTRLEFPLVVKPVAEGSSKGISDDSVVSDTAALWRVVGFVNQRYRQQALIERFLPGREFTVGILGNGESAAVLPIMEIIFLDSFTPHRMYSFAVKQDWKRYVRYDAPARIDPALKTEIEEMCLKAYEACKCRDAARLDVRLDGNGRPHLLDVNALPGICPGYSDLVFVAEAAGLSHAGLVGAILENAATRYGIL